VDPRVGEQREVVVRRVPAQALGRGRREKERRRQRVDRESDEARTAGFEASS
jgi:hypothetical protein